MAAETLHLTATAFMAGVIAFVQGVHYPLLGRVGSGAFVAYERRAAGRTGWVVVPAMLVEAASALWLARAAWGSADQAVALTGVALLAVIWASTALLQAPAHGRLMSGFDARVHRRLVRSNWIRTVAWGARLPLAVALAA